MSAAELLLIGLMIIVALTGGSGRDDTASLLLLRPISFVALAAAIGIAYPALKSRDRGLQACVWMTAVLVALQLVPLPPSIWHQLPGRELAIAIDRATGMENAWRPITLVPHRTINALLSLALPIAVFLLALVIDRKHHWRIIAVLLALLSLSALFGLLQVSGGSANPFYLYRLTNDGSAVGLFANRNHQAVLLAMGFPLVAALAVVAGKQAEQERAVHIAAVAFGFFLLPSILVTGSRAGIVLVVLSMLSVLFVIQPSLRGNAGSYVKWLAKPGIVAIAIGAVIIIVLSVQMTAENSVMRIIESDPREASLRLGTWPAVWDLAHRSLPFGTGMGTFVEAYWTVEQDSLLRPQYMNHAHNDFLELALTGGIPFILLLVFTAGLVTRGYLVGRTMNESSWSRMLRRLGLVVLIILCLASIYDYPIRTPLHASILAIALVWAGARSVPDLAKKGKARDA